MGLLDDLTGKSAKEANEANKGFGINMSQALKNWVDQIYGVAFQGIEGGYGAGLDEIAKIGASAKDDILRREQGQMGQLSQDMMSRGLSGTTIAPNMQRGVASDTNRSLGSLAEQLAGLRSGVMIQQGNARAGLGQDYANALQNIMHNRMSFLQGYQHEGGGLGETLAGIGKAAGGLSGLFSSDERLKESISTLDQADALEVLRSLDAFRWSWNEESADVGKEPGARDMGFVAQEVQRVLPEAVVEHESGYLAINPAPIMAALVIGVQNLMWRVQELEGAAREESA